jgi:hypothetical protein
MWRRSAFLILFLAFPALADLTQSALTGSVTIGDAPASGATVTITSRATNTVRIATTNARGTYWIGALTPGEYDVTFSRAGFGSLTRPATIELGRITRSDARLEASEDEETVLSTVKTVSVAETTAITTHFWSDELERVPLRRDVSSAAELAPVILDGETIVDDATLFFPTLLGEEVLEEVTIVRGAQPIELDGFGGNVILARTRSGSDAFSLSLRDTYATRDGGGNVLESTSAGRIVPERLWFFAAGWAGDANDLRLRKLRGLVLNATAQATPSQQFVVSHIDADAKFSSFDFGTTATSLRYTGVFREQMIAEAIVSRSRGHSEDVRLRGDEMAAKVSYRIGDHVLSAGGNRSDRTSARDVDALHVGDRWSVGRWVIDAGVRREDERSMPRIAAAFDLRSNRGSHALVASWGEYLESPFTPAGVAHTPLLRVATFGYTSSLESSGAARIDVLHFDGARNMDQLQADARYRLFDRFEAGGSYVHTRGDDTLPEHLASARVGVQVPFAGHELAAMVLERYDSTHWTTDVGVRYDVPIARLAVTIAGDATNLFDATTTLTQPRSYRVWLRARL